MWTNLLTYYADLKKVGIDGIVIILAILGTHFIKIYLLKGMKFYTKENKGLINGITALTLSIIGSFLFTEFIMDFYKTAFASFIVSIGAQGIMQWFEIKFIKKER